MSLDAVLSPHTWSHGIMYRKQGRLGVSEIWVCDIFQTIMRNGRVGGRGGWVGGLPQLGPKIRFMYSQK